MVRRLGDHGYQFLHDVDKSHIPLDVLANLSIDGFLLLCERIHGAEINGLARTLLVERAFAWN